MLDRLFAAGQMPTLRGLIERGVRADLSTLDPKLSPLLWTSIATGKTADKHGILNFVEPDPAGDGIRLAASTTRRTKALWNILTQSGMTVHVVNWYASHPAEPIRGTCVTNLIVHGEPAADGSWSVSPNVVHPVGATDVYTALRVAPSSIKLETLRRFVPSLDRVTGDERIRTLATHIAHANTVHAAALQAIRMSDAAWDCTMIFSDAIDTLGHHFMPYLAPRMSHVSGSDGERFGGVMDEVYRTHDAMLGELLEAAGSDTTVMLLSDHGFYSDHRRPVIARAMTRDSAEAEAMWHRPTGVLVLSGPGVVRGQRVISATILDAAPTALALLGLPRGDDMDGRALVEALDPPLNDGVVSSWDAIDGEAGMHSPDARQDPFEAHDAIRQLIDLGYMAALPESVEQQIRLVERETKFNLAVVYLTTGRAELAIPLFAALSAEEPKQSRFALALGDAQFKSHRFADAAETVNAFLEHTPQSCEARILLAGALLSLDRLDEAAEETRRLELAARERPDLAISLGDLSCGLQRWNAAAVHYRAVLARDPGAVGAHLGLARAAIGARQFEAAAEHALDAVERQHVLPEAHHLLGVALAWLGDEEHAIQSFDVALSMQPGLLEARRFLLALRTRRKEVHEAEKQRSILRSVVLRTAEPDSPTGARAWARHAGVEANGVEG